MPSQETRAAGDRQRPALTRDLILKEALVLLDEEGLPRCTMRQIAARLGCTDMALYRHFASRDEVLDAVLESLLCQMGAPPREGQSWEERAHVHFSSLFTLFRQHPQALPALLDRPLSLPSIDRGRAAGQELLVEHGFSASEALDITDSLAAYTLGYAALLCGGYFGQVQPAVPERSRSRRKPAGGCPGNQSEADWEAAQQAFERGLTDILAGLGRIELAT